MVPVAVIGVFGKLKDTIVTLKGDPLDSAGPQTWGPTPVPPNVLTLVHSYTVPTDGKRSFINLVTAVGENYCRVELRRNAVVLFEDRSSPSGVSLFRSFPEGAEWIGVAGDEFEVWIEHYDDITLNFSGVLGGFRTV